MGTGQTFAPDAAAIERLAEAAIARLPEHVPPHLANVVLRIEDFADDEVLAALGIEDPFDLTGLYQRPLARQAGQLGLGRAAADDPPLPPPSARRMGGDRGRASRR